MSKEGSNWGHEATALPFALTGEVDSSRALIRNTKRCTQGTYLAIYGRVHV